MEERKILVARTAGFCFGVKRAVEKVYEQVNMGKQNIYTYGPIIHNEEVVTDLHHADDHRQPSDRDPQFCADKRQYHECNGDGKKKTGDQSGNFL